MNYEKIIQDEVFKLIGAFDKVANYNVSLLKLFPDKNKQLLTISGKLLKDKEENYTIDIYLDDREILFVGRDKIIWYASEVMARYLGKANYRVEFDKVSIYFVSIKAALNHIDMLAKQGYRDFLLETINDTRNGVPYE